MQEPDAFESGSWVVHRLYGVGQIKGLEVKHISEKENSYYKVETLDSVFWIPLDKMNDEWLRPVATQAEIEKALLVLGSPPRQMAASLNHRKNRINKVTSSDTPATIAELIRDLWALKKEKKTLSMLEEQALRHFTSCFLSEWSVCMELDIDVVKQEIDVILKRQRENEEDG